MPNADEVRDFYAAVVGWTAEPESMGDYADYNMIAPGGERVAGVCFARGENANVPPQWLVYINVVDLAASMDECNRHGGTVLSGPRDLGSYGQLAIIRDPAGAVAALLGPMPAEKPGG